MNWGKGIAITLGLFMTFITVLVVMMINTKVDLVTDNYYQKEVEFQDRIDESKNFNDLDNPPSITLDNNNINFIFPTNNEFTNINVDFFRPSNEDHDKTIRIDGNESFTLNKSDFEKGNYQIKLTFKLDSNTYLLTKEVYL